MYKHDIVSEVLSPGKNKVDLIMPCNTFLGFPFPVICYKYFMHVQGQWKRKLLTPTEGPNPKVPGKKTHQKFSTYSDFVISPCHCVTKCMSTTSSGLSLSRAVRYHTFLKENPYIFQCEGKISQKS